MPDPESVKYLMRSLSGYTNRARHLCPACGCADTVVVSRKLAITALKRCGRCRLQFRTPTDPEAYTEQQYQTQYRSGGLTTTLPDAAALAGLMNDAFAGTDKDFSQKIAVLAQAGVPRGAKVLDFGASWGYATWQLVRAGYSATGYEISAPRAAYGVEHLAVSIATSETALSPPYDAIFTSHVLEHFADPMLAVRKMLTWLAPGGVIVSFNPNGSARQLPERKEVFDRHWGRLHPVHLDENVFLHAIPASPILLTSRNYGDWGLVGELKSWSKTASVIGDLARPELLSVIAGPSPVRTT